MMKKFLMLFCGLFFLIAEAHSSPIYLSVTGTIDHINGYPIGTFSVGDTLNFIVMYDYERSGYRYNGTNIETPGYSYYSEYIGGDALSFDPSYYPSVNQYNYPHYGVNVSSKYYQLFEQEIHTSTDIYSFFMIYRGGSTAWWHGAETGFDSWEWEIGDGVSIRTSNNREDIYLKGVVSALSDKNPFNPVPAPSTIILLGMGLLCLAGVNRKKTETIPFKQHKP